jgi:LmbE family N-acetylglucosaminyl deacetylase
MTRVGVLIMLASTLLIGPALAQEIAMDAGRLAHALDRLSNTGRVLYIAAHPDDENTRLLAYLANERHVSATYLAMTRGGGGQNLIGREQDALLDALRTQELLAARRLDGAQQRFTRMRDFGYSKSARETLAIWDHEEALADVVLAIRAVRPDVVITRFDEQPPNHGHHTASAILAREAFSAAADPTRFPQQIERGFEPWQAQRLLRNLPSWRDAPAPPKDALVLDVGAYDVRLGLSYGELAARSRSQHKSQGFGALGERGALLERFVPVAGTPAGSDLLDGVELGWGRFGAAGARVEAELQRARQQLHRDHPERALAPLLEARRALAALPASDPRVRDAHSESLRLIAAASGLFVRATAARASCVPGSALPVRIELILRRPVALAVHRIVLPGGATLEPDGRLVLHERFEHSAELTCPSDTPVSAPHWLAEAPLAGRHVVNDLSLSTAPEAPPPLRAAVELELDGEPMVLETPVVHVWQDRVHGERERPVLIVPPATVTPTRAAVMFPNDRPATVTLRVRAGGEDTQGRVFLDLPDGWRATPTDQQVKLAQPGDETTLSFVVTPPRGAQGGEARPVIEVAGERWSWREDVIDYPHVPMQVVLQPAKLRLSPVQLSPPRGRIGFVEGSGDTLALDLQHIGASVEVLDDAAILQGDLDRFAAIVLGVRAHNTRDVLRTAHERLMKYVERGGTLLVQYVTRSSLSPLEAPIGPFPLEIGRGRVTDEAAVVTLLEPDHAVLRTPHRLTSADFDGWVQERGLYFGERWDERYRPLLELADPDEPVQRGALLVARHGRGRYIYTGLSLFRQLPAGVPGAYRLLLNLLARASEKPP